MTYTCPHCHSHRIISPNHGRKTCSAIGSLAGAHVAIQGVRMGTMVGRFFGPPGIIIGGTAGLIFAGISGAMLGGSTGARLGTMIDNNVLNNYRCLNCNRSFSKPSRTLEGEYLTHEDIDDEGPDYPVAR